MNRVLVVGAGPAGIAAAVAAAESGCRVTVVDDNAAAGGQIWRGYREADAGRLPHGRAFSAWMRRLRAVEVEILTGSRVVDQPAPGMLRLESENEWVDLSYERLILATGARERFLPFPGWTLPGVMGAGGLQAMVKAGLPVRGKRVAIAGSGPLLLAVAANLSREGAQIAGAFEQASFARLAKFGAGLLANPGKLLEGARYRERTPYKTSSWVTRAHGTERLQSVSISVNGTVREIACYFLACGFHLVPNLEMPRLLGCNLDDGFVRVDRSQQSSVRGVFCVGELTGVGGLEKALLEGEIAGLVAGGRAANHLFAKRDRGMRFARRLEAAFALRDELRHIADAETIVCRCEDVRLGSLQGLRTAREAKLHTRCGMGPCQGRVCSPATEFLFGWEPAGVRPPIVPARVETLAAAAQFTPIPNQD